MAFTIRHFLHFPMQRSAAYSAGHFQGRGAGWNLMFRLASFRRLTHAPKETLSLNITLANEHRIGVPEASGLSSRDDLVAAVPDVAPSNRAPHGTGISCPVCSSTDCYRSKRNGWRDFIRRLPGMFPWRCKACRHRFYLRKRCLPS